jgi:hypothetical protein
VVVRGSREGSEAGGGGAAAVVVDDAPDSAVPWVTRKVGGGGVAAGEGSRGPAVGRGRRRARNEEGAMRSEEGTDTLRAPAAEDAAMAAHSGETEWEVEWAEGLGMGRGQAGGFAARQSDAATPPGVVQRADHRPLATHARSVAQGEEEGQWPLAESSGGAREAERGEGTEAEARGGVRREPQPVASLASTSDLSESDEEVEFSDSVDEQAAEGGGGEGSHEATGADGAAPVDSGPLAGIPIPRTSYGIFMSKEATALPSALESVDDSLSDAQAAAARESLQSSTSKKEEAMSVWNADGSYNWRDRPRSTRAAPSALRYELVMERLEEYLAFILSGRLDDALRLIEFCTESGCAPFVP